MHCQRTNAHIHANECPGIILGTQDRTLFTVCRACDEGKRLMAAVCWQHDVPQDADPVAHNISAPEESTMQQADMPHTINEVATLLNVPRRVIDNILYFLRRGKAPVRGKLREALERMRELGIQPEQLSPKGRQRTEPAPVPTPTPALTAAQEEAPVSSFPENVAAGMEPDPNVHDSSFLAALDRLTEAQAPLGAEHFPLEILITEIQRRLPRSVVVLR